MKFTYSPEVQSALEFAVKTYLPEFSKALITASQAARRLGVSRGRTLPKLVESGAVRRVQVGAEHRYNAADVERIVVKGLGEAVGPRRKPPATRPLRRVRAPLKRRRRARRRASSWGPAPA